MSNVVIAMALRKSEFSHSETKQDAFGIQALVNGLWLDIGCRNCRALWSVESSRDAALARIQRSNGSGRLIDWLSGDGTAAAPTKMWEPAAMSEIAA